MNYAETLRFLHTLARALALANQGALSCDPQSYLPTLSKVALFDPATPLPRSAAQAPVLAWSIDLLATAEMLHCRSDELRPTTQASHWLAWPLEEQLRYLRDVWWLHPEMNAAWLPATRHQSEPLRHYEALFLAVCQWISQCPLRAWQTLDMLQAFLQSQGLIRPPGKAAHLPNVTAAYNRRINDLISHIINAPLQMLGLVEINAAREPLRVRSTPEGHTWLRAALERRALWQAPPSSEGTVVELAVPPTPLTLLPLPSPPLALADLPAHAALRLEVALPAPPHVTYHVMHMAEPRTKAPGEAMAYHVTRESLEKALAYGYALPDVVLMLGRWSGGEAAPAVWNRLAAWQDAICVIPYTLGYDLHNTGNLPLSTYLHSGAFPFFSTATITF